MFGRIKFTLKLENRINLAGVTRILRTRFLFSLREEAIGISELHHFPTRIRQTKV